MSQRGENLTEMSAEKRTEFQRQKKGGGEGGRRELIRRNV